jgi:hypothetical protein
VNIGAAEGEGKGFRNDVERRSCRIFQAYDKRSHWTKGQNVQDIHKHQRSLAQQQCTGAHAQFPRLIADARFEHVDECLSSIISRIPSSAGSVSAGEVYVVVGCGRSGMVRSRD